MSIVDDMKAAILGLVGSAFSSAVGWIRIETMVDTAIVAIITVLITFYGNKFLRWLHDSRKKKKS